MMSRELRHVPPGGARFEITTRTLQSRFLLPTGAYYRTLVIGILARAKELFPIELYAFGGLSNHLHLLVGAEDVDLLAGFMGYVNSNLAREANRIVGWSDKFWGRRYKPIQISDEEEALVGRLRYLLSHGVKEGLVLRCRDWPGLQCVEALTEDKPLEGIWIDRSREYELRRRGQDPDPGEWTTRYTLELDPLPCWKHLSRAEMRQRITGMVDEIDAENARRIVLNGGAPLGVEAILRQHPHDCPKETKKSPAPAVHAASKSVRKMLKEAHRLFVEAYRSASERLRAGDLTVEFPLGCFPPARPFVSSNGTSRQKRAGPTVTPG